MKSVSRIPRPAVRAITDAATTSADDILLREKLLDSREVALAVRARKLDDRERACAQREKMLRDWEMSLQMKTDKMKTYRTLKVNVPPTPDCDRATGAGSTAAFLAAQQVEVGAQAAGVQLPRETRAGARSARNARSRVDGPGITGLGAAARRRA